MCGGVLHVNEMAFVLCTSSRASTARDKVRMAAIYGTVRYLFTLLQSRTGGQPWSSVVEVE